jgi:hypothetical protein
MSLVNEAVTEVTSMVTAVEGPILQSEFLQAVVADGADVRKLTQRRATERMRLTKFRKGIATIRESLDSPDCSDPEDPDYKRLVDSEQELIRSLVGGSQRIMSRLISTIAPSQGRSMYLW